MKIGDLKCGDIKCEECPLYFLQDSYCFMDGDPFKIYFDKPIKEIMETLYKEEKEIFDKEISAKEKEKYLDKKKTTFLYF